MKLRLYELKFIIFVFDILTFYWLKKTVPLFNFIMSTFKCLFQYEFDHKILIAANKEIELFNVRPSFVFSSPTPEMKKFFLSFRLLVQLIL